MRSRTKVPAVSVKPAPNVGLTLFVAGDSLAGDWLRLVVVEKDIEGTDIRTLRPGRPDEDFMILNPAQTLPTLADREGVLTSARVIAEYLDERYPHPPLMPLAPAARARVRITLEWLEGQLFPMAEAVAAGGSGAAAASRELVAALKAAARQFPANGYFHGSDYSLSDCAWAVLLRAVANLALPLPPELSSVRAYAGKLAGRRAFQRAFPATATTAAAEPPAANRRRA